MSPHVFRLADAASQGSPASGHADGAIQLGVHWNLHTPYGLVHVDTVVYSAIVMVLCLIVFGALGQLVTMRPMTTKIKRATTIEWLVGFIQKMLDDFVGHGSGKYLWYIGSLFIFILSCNWLALLPWRAWELAGWGDSLSTMFHTPIPLVYDAPTADINTTAGLAILSLLMYWIAGIGKNGIVGFLGHHWFAKPWPLFPLRMIEDITRPLSLALRLFSNILAGHVVGIVLLGMAYIGAAALLPMEMLVGAIQAFIFATLSASYIGAAVQEHH